MKKRIILKKPLRKTTELETVNYKCLTCDHIIGQKKPTGNKRLCNDCKQNKFYSNCQGFTAKNNLCTCNALVSLDNKYCLHHLRNYFLDLHEKNGQLPCGKLLANPSRCLNYLDDMKYKNCSECRIKDRPKDRQRHAKKNMISINSEITNEDDIRLKICGHCGQKQEVNNFITERGADSLKCNECRSKLKLIDAKRRQKFRETGELTLNQKFNDIVKSARRRNKEFELTLNETIELIKQNCYYCDDPSASDNLCGLDRVDNDRGYLSDNVVPACTPCNIMKFKDNEKDFINRVIHIVTYMKLFEGTLDSNLFNFAARAKYSLYEADANNKKAKRVNTKNDYFCDLTEEEFNEIIQDPCAYCGTESESENNIGGIDRVDNTIGYTIENSVSCCTVCNFIKRHLKLEDFITQAIKIATKWFPVLLKKNPEKKSNAKDQEKYRNRIINEKGRQEYRKIQNKYYKAISADKFYDIEKIKLKIWTTKHFQEQQPIIVNILENWNERKKPSFKYLSEQTDLSIKQIRRICLRL